MITLYRPANYTNPRASEFTGRSIDTKPVDVENGSMFTEIDTGRAYKFDAENKVWLEYKPTGIASEVKSVNGQTGNVVLTAADVGALPDSTVVPTKTSELNNDSEYITNAALADYAKTADIPTAVSQLTNDSGYVTEAEAQAAAPVQSVNGSTGTVSLDADDVGALPITGGTLTGNLTVQPEGTTAVIVAPMGSGANVVVKESDTALTTIMVSPSSKTVHMYDGTTQDPIVLRGIADPQTDTDAVSKKWIESTYGTMDATNATFAFPVVSRVKNVAGVVDDLDAANKYYVDQRVQYAVHTIHSVSIDANGTHSEQVSVKLPTGITSVQYDFYVSVNGQNLMALCSATRTEAVSSSSGSWLRVRCLAYNPSSDAISGDIVIHVLCVHK